MKKIAHSAVTRWRRKQQSPNRTEAEVNVPERTTPTDNRMPKMSSASVVPAVENTPAAVGTEATVAKAAQPDESVKSFLDTRCRLSFNVLTEVTEMRFNKSFCRKTR